MSQYVNLATLDDGEYSSIISEQAWDIRYDLLELSGGGGAWEREIRSLDLAFSA